MPSYKVVDSPTYFKNIMRQPGEIVEWSGWPGSTLEPVDDVAKRIKDYYAIHRRSPRLPPQPDLAKFAEAEPEPVEDKSNA